MVEPTTARDPRGGAVTAVLLAAGCFSLTLFLNFGYYSPLGVAIVGLGVAALAAGTVLVARGGWAGLGIEAALVAWLAVAVTMATTHEWWSIFVATSPHDWQPATTKWLVGAGFLAVLVGAWRDPRGLRILRPLLFAGALVLGAHWTIEQTPSPAIDVWHMHQAAAERLADGDNPYTVGFPNPYRPAETVDFYAYPPVTLLVQLPFHALLGDVRYASAVALVVAGYAVRRLGLLARLPAYAADAAGALVVVQGRPFYQVEQGWTEPIVLALLCLGALAWLRRPSLGVTWLAVALASKQYLMVLVPGVVLLPGVRRRDVLMAAGVVAALILPFFLWGPTAFWDGIVTSHLDGGGLEIAYPGHPEDEPWPNTNNLAVALDREHQLDWPMWIGTGTWLASAGLFFATRRRTAGLLLLCAAAGVGLLGYLGRALHPNYIAVLPGIALAGLLVDLAARPSATPAAPTVGTAAARSDI